jgi:hypothetical protein
MAGEDTDVGGDKGLQDTIVFRMQERTLYVVCPLGLEVEKIHACQDGCMLFHNEDTMLEECCVCGTSQYK